MTTPPKSAAGRALVGVTISMLALSWITVIIRVWVRKWIKGLGLDDHLMVIGLILFTVSAQNILSAAYNGVGTPDVYLDEATVREGRKWFWICSVIYPFTALAIKCSICTALLRISNQRRYRIPLYSIMVLSFIASLTTSLTLLVWCRPIAANWDARAGTCPNAVILSNVSYYLSANSILTDWACAVLPAIILWDIQLKTRIKVSVVMLLAMGVVASAATIVRLAYFTAYNSPTNYMYGLAKIAVWSMLECGLGIVAGSIATFRPLFRFIPFLSQSSYATRSGALNGRSHHLEDLNRSAVINNALRHDPEDPERSDAESQKHILKKTVIEVSD